MTAIVRCCLLAFDMPFTLLYVALAESSCRHTEAADSQLAILSSLRTPHVRLDMVVPLLAVAARKNTVAAQFRSHKLHQSCLSWFMRARGSRPAVEADSECRLTVAGVASVEIC